MTQFKNIVDKQNKPGRLCLYDTLCYLCSYLHGLNKTILNMVDFVLCMTNLIPTVISYKSSATVHLTDKPFPLRKSYFRFTFTFNHHNGKVIED